jgi:DNA-binding Xre family transcriptional regulator
MAQSNPPVHAILGAGLEPDQMTEAWREHRGREVTDLRRATRISVGRLEQLETGKGKKMDEEEERLLARVLEIDRACLRPMSLAGCSALDVDEDEILARDE